MIEAAAPDRPSVFKTTGAIVAGLAAFAALEFVATFVARATWPAYALAAPTRDYTLEMLGARLGAGALAALVAGAVAARADRTARQAALIFGVVLLLVSALWHYRIWSQYPVWYHLCWFACIVPASVLGGMVARGEAAR